LRRYGDFDQRAPDLGAEGTAPLLRGEEERAPARPPADTRNGARAAPGSASRPAIGFVWDRFGPYHVDRCEATARLVGDRYEVVGVEIASYDDIYRWSKSRGSELFRKVTLFPNMRRNEVAQWRCLRALIRFCLRERVRYLFLCNYEDPVIFAAAIVLRLLGRPVIVMQDSKFDDKQRRIVWELLKWALYLPYNGALAGSPRTASYLEFLGLPREHILLGYDTVSLARIRGLAGAPPAPHGMPHAARHFTIIARFVPKKNLGMALDAYARYAAAAGGTARELHLCGSGEMEAELRARAASLGTRVRFLGFLQEEGIARTLASSLALLLPSVEEQFGLVVNEAVAMGVPVLLSENCGARDVLVRSGVNGFIVEPDNPDGLAHYMTLLDRDAEEWRRLSRNCAEFAPLADAARFAEAVERVLAGFAPRRRRWSATA
jgi:glycosyltransferase involved in cell wall biosynthesis